MFLLCLIFIVCIFWVLQIANYTVDGIWAEIIAKLLAVGDIFYGENVKIFSYYLDFSYPSTILVFGFLIYVLNFMVEAKKNIEQQAEILKEKQKKADEQRLNKELQTKFVTEELKNKNCSILLDMNGHYEKRGWDDNADKVITSKELFDNFINRLEQNNISLKISIYENKLLIEIDNIAQVDIKLNVIYVLLNKMKEDLYNEACIMDWCGAIDTYKYEYEKSAKLNRLMKALEVAFSNGIICFNSFKIRYELNQNRKYTLVSLGGYNIEDDDLEIFKLKRIE